MDAGVLIRCQKLLDTPQNITIRQIRGGVIEVKKLARAASEGICPVFYERLIAMMTATTRRRRADPPPSHVVGVEFVKRK